MEIYFIRHGETASNVAKRHQLEHTHLTERGKRQAAAVAKQIAILQPTHLVTSPQVRAVETAEVVGEVTGLMSVINEQVKELMRPSGMYGWRHRSPRSLWYLVRWFYGVGVGDGETYAAFRERIEAAQTYLASLPQDARVVVVSHSVFINLFLVHMCDSHRLSLWRAARTLARIFKTKNADIIHVRYVDVGEAHVCAWQEVVE